jgi:FkbM family methyltransferase
LRLEQATRNNPAIFLAWIRSWFTRVRLYLLGREVFVRKEVSLGFSTFGTIYGSWPVLKNSLDVNSVVYSVGVGTDISWDLELIRLFGVTINAFDPTPRSLEWAKAQNLPSEFVFRRYALAGEDGKLRLYVPKKEDFVSFSIVKKDTELTEYIEVEALSLASMMRMLNHDRVDLLKIDIEGAEYGVIGSLVSQSVLPKQLLIEFHHRFREIGAASTILALRKLKDLGYRIFYVSPRGNEIGFVLSDG